MWHTSIYWINKTFLWSPYLSLGFWLLFFLDNVVQTDSCSGLPWIRQNNCMCSCFIGDHKNTSGKKRENNGGRITLSNNWTCNSFWQDRSVSSFKYFSTSRLKTIPFAVPNSIKRPINFGTVIFKQICRNNQTPIFHLFLHPQANTLVLCNYCQQIITRQQSTKCWVHIFRRFKSFELSTFESES